MTASSMRCCKRSEHGLLAAFAALWLALAVLLPASAFAQGIETKRAVLAATDDGYRVEAEFDVSLTHALEDALSKGVPLFFLFEFELYRPRWYWFSEKITSVEQQYRLSYNALTRQYRIGVGTLHQNLATLREALEVMGNVRRRVDIESGALRKDSGYVAGVRMRLDTSQLPRPFQLNAVGSRDWYVASDWQRWTVSP